MYLRPDEQAQRTALAGACRQRPVGTASKAQKSNPRKAVNSLQRSYMGLGRVELPTSRLSGDRRGVGSPARNLYSVDGRRDLP